MRDAPSEIWRGVEERFKAVVRQSVERCWVYCISF
jgi:hypothetical protein